jgi:hypothetical protein
LTIAIGALDRAIEAFDHRHGFLLAEGVAIAHAGDVGRDAISGNIFQGE